MKIYIASETIDSVHYELGARDAKIEYKTSHSLSEALRKPNDWDAIIIDEQVPKWPAAIELLRKQYDRPIAVFTSQPPEEHMHLSKIYPISERNNLKTLTEIIQNLTAKKPQIMIVDDQKELLKLYSEMAEMKGYQTKTFESIEEAMPHTQWPHVVLTDLDAPKKDSGYNLIEKIRKQTNYTPILLMSGRPLKGNTRVDVILSKPFSQATYTHYLELFVPQHLKQTQKQ